MIIRNLWSYNNETGIKNKRREETLPIGKVNRTIPFTQTERTTTKKNFYPKQELFINKTQQQSTESEETFKQKHPENILPKHIKE